MLSIRFDHEHEWWVSGASFERLFQRALACGELEPTLAEWQHIADANGGISLSGVEPTVAAALEAALRATAAAELLELAKVPLQSADGTYKASLEKLLKLFDTT